MQEELYERYKTQIEYETGKNFLVFDLSEKQAEEIYDYQIEMIAANPQNFIIPFEVRRKDEEIKLYYDITSRVSLADYLRSKTITGIELVKLLYTLMQNIKQGRNLLLEDRGFIMHEEAMYFDLMENCLCMVYLPVHMNNNVCSDLKSFTVRLLGEKMKSEADPEAVILTELISFVNSDGFGVVSFGRFLDDLLKSVPDMNRIGAQTFEKYVPKAEQGKYSSNIKKNNEKEASPSGTKNTLPEFDVISAILLIASQIVIIGVSAAADSFMKVKAVDTLTRYAAIGLFVLILDVAIFKLFISKNKRLYNSSIHKGKKADEVIAHSYNKTKPPVKEKIHIKLEKQGDIKIKRPVFESQKEDLCEELAAADIKCLDQETEAGLSFDETTLLTNKTSSSGYLVRVANDMEEKVRIDKDCFAIGRKAEKCDLVIPDKSVGRLHAEIMNIQDEYYIIDKDSKNGTYVNDERVAGDREVKLNNGDRIMLANVEYIFIVE